MKLKYIALLMSIALIHNAQAKIIETIESVYTQDADQEIIDLAQNVANLVEYTNNFEVMAPKKAGRLINPWNKFVGHGINPQTKNPFIMINPEWFKTIAPDQQTFLLARSFLTLKHGPLSAGQKMLPYLSILFTFLCIFIFYLVINRTRLVQYPRWMRIVLAFLIMVVCNLTFMNNAYQKLYQYLGKRFDTSIHHLAVEKTGNKEAAIAALEHLAASIKNEIDQSDNSLLATGDKLFEEYANDLRNMH